MKYGETLRQRSIPGWAEHNIDYDEIKLLIKDHTTPGKGKAVSVPGHGNAAEHDFEKRLFGIFLRENDNVSLFVKTKVLEIERSLDGLDRRFRKLQLQSQAAPSLTDQPRPDAYRRLEQRTVATGEVIKSLSRFITTNRTAFYKLLKKYKKWTGSEALGRRVRAEILHRTDSFARVDIEQLLNHWTAILHDIRLVMSSHKRFEELTRRAGTGIKSPQIQPMSGEPRESSANVARHIYAAIQSGSDLDFDLTLAETLLGSQGKRAVYWVHPDHLIELQVVLSHYLKLYPPEPSNRTGTSSQPNSPTHTRRASLIHQDSPVGIEGDCGIILLDRLDDYAQRSSAAPVIDSEETPGQNVAATIRWTTTDEAVVSVKGIAGTEMVKPAKLRRRYIKAFLDLERSFTPWRDHESSSPERRPPLERPPSQIEGNPDFARNWLDAHRNIRPLVSISSRRTRFVDLQDGNICGQWCTLDAEIEMNKIAQDDLAARDWPLQSTDGWRFPHAILEVRQEGTTANNIIAMLDQSHLTERVRGFSIAYHAVYTCWTPKNMTQPFWLPVLRRDIRKLPEPAIGSHRRKRTLNDSGNDTQKRENASSSGDNTSGEQTGSNTLVGQSSTASYLTTPSDVQPKETPKPKRKVRYVDDIMISKELRMTPTTTRYWNEYDYPGDGDGSGASDEGYYIYMDPNEKFQWPGAGLFQRLKALIKGRKAASEKDDEESAAILPDSPLISTAKKSGKLVQSPTSPTSASSPDDDSSSTSETDTTGAHTLNRWGQRQRQSKPTSYGTMMRNITSTAPPPYVAPASRSAFRLSTVSLSASFALLITITVLAATGRHRQRGEVDAGIVFGIVTSLAFGLVGMLAAIAGARETPGHYTWMRWSLVGGCFGVVCVGCGVMLGWVLGGFG